MSQRFRLSLSLLPPVAYACALLTNLFLAEHPVRSFADIASINQRTIDNVASGSNSAFVTNPLTQMAGVHSHDSEDDEEDLYDDDGDAVGVLQE